MKIDFNQLEDTLFNMLDQVKVLISQETWENILLNCTKNEMLVLMLLYRGSFVNMSQIAEYLNVPLNTATGIVTRMEKKNMIQRERSIEDKRVVTIVLTDEGKAQIKAMISAFMHYGQKVLSVLTEEELRVTESVIGKVLQVIQEEGVREQKTSVVRKITIE